MSKINISQLGVLSLVFLCSWTAKQIQEPNTIDWLIGTWEHKSAKGSIFESWLKQNNQELNGTSYFMKLGDTVVLESIRLVKEGQAWYYCVKVNNQNNGLAVKFRATQINESQFIFENPNHDFPQMIRYTKINKDSVVAEISGVKNGQNNKLSIPMKRHL